MAESYTAQAVLGKLGLTENEKNLQVFTAAGLTPASISHAEIKKTITILGITPDDFSNVYSSAEFNYDTLKSTFRQYCKDFGDILKSDSESKALEFSAKILFELGPYIRTEKKNKGDKAIRFRFPYVKKEGATQELSIKVVIVSTFREGAYTKMEDGGKMIMTFKQAGLLAMETFCQALDFCYQQNGALLMTSLCGAIYSRDVIDDIAKELKLDNLTTLTIVNQSTSAGGQYLPYSDMSCAIASTIAATKRVSDKNVRSMMVLKVVKQYSHKGKPYYPERFKVFAEYALGGVPPGMDPETLIDNFTNIQIAKVNLRTQMLSIKQSEKVTMVPGTSDTKTYTTTSTGRRGNKQQ